MNRYHFSDRNKFIWRSFTWKFFVSHLNSTDDYTKATRKILFASHFERLNLNLDSVWTNLEKKNIFCPDKIQISIWTRKKSRRVCPDNLDQILIWTNFAHLWSQIRKTILKAEECKWLFSWTLFDLSFLSSCQTYIN